MTVCLMKRPPPVLYSLSHDVHLNLAFEDWLYREHDWSPDRRLLLLWRNAPCVVIGRHQNPWLECRLASMARRGVVLARRNSGGGAVFHDLGNLNCTFFSARAAYNRRANLQIICAALANRWPHLNVRISPREDILLDDHFKISGTAAKLGRIAAYHHCTLLHGVDTTLLSQVLRTSADKAPVDSKATASVASPVRNLDSVCCDDLVQTIAQQFLLVHELPPQPCVDVLPTEEQFPGLTALAEELRSWQWNFGRSPSFTVHTTHCRHPSTNVSISITCSRGLIESIQVVPPHTQLGAGCEEDAIQSFTGLPLPTSTDWPHAVGLDSTSIGRTIIRNLTNVLLCT